MDDRVPEEGVHLVSKAEVIVVPLHHRQVGVHLKHEIQAKEDIFWPMLLGRGALIPTHSGTGLITAAKDDNGERNYSCQEQGR